VVGGWVVGESLQAFAACLAYVAPPAYSIIVLLNGLPQELCNYFAHYILINNVTMASELLI
jgi:hypothetical protein